jgi:hypothetical protein
MLTQLTSSGQVSEEHYDQVAHAAPAQDLGAALAQTFRADGTPPIGDMVGQLFGRSDAQQQAGLLNQILSAVGPAAAAGLAGGVLGRMLSPGAQQLTPEQASQLTPEQVKAVVNEAHTAQPGLADQLGSFYAQHAGLIKTLGSAALLFTMAHLKQRMDRSA